MAYRKLLLLFAGIIGLVSFSCKDNPTDVGIGLLKNNLVNLKTLDSSADSLRQTSSYFKRTIPLGSGTKLLLGNYNDATGSVLLRFLFFNIPDSIATGFTSNSVVISSAIVNLYPNLTYGDSLANLDFTVHKVNSYWGTTTFDADSLPGLSYDQNDISTNRNFTDSLASFSLDKTVVGNWLTSYIDSNYSAIQGIYLKPTPDSKKMVAYQAFSSLTGYYSQLTVVFEKAGVYKDTISFLPIGDISVIQATTPQIKSGEIVVQGGVTYNSKLWFDASKIPANATINQATLSLNIDTVNSHYSVSVYNGITLWNLADSSANAIDSSKSITLSLSGSTIQGNITPLVQKWIDSHKNQGMLIEDYSATEGVDLYAIKSSSYADYNARPKLKILYTTRN